MTGRREAQVDGTGVGVSAVMGVVLAAGRGTRMQVDYPALNLTPDQAAAADAGHKMLIPMHGTPFIAYVLHEMAEAGITDVCLVVGPGRDDPVRVTVEALGVHRLHVSFAVQDEPRGSAHALLAAEEVVGDRSMVVINADNVYPAQALQSVAALDGPGLVGFDGDALVARSNIPASRVADFALVEVRDGRLVSIVEKPDPSTALGMGDAPVSMTCWRFEPSIFDACRAVKPSSRGELELVDAVTVAMDRGEVFRVVPMAAGVLDLSHRADIPVVERRLARVEPRP